MFNFLDGYKTYALGAFAILVGLLKFVFDLPEVESISVLGADEPWTLITAGWALIAGRSATKKMEKS